MKGEPQGATRIVAGYILLAVVFLIGSEVVLTVADADAMLRIVLRSVFIALTAVWLSVAIRQELRLRHEAERRMFQSYEAEHRARLGVEHARRHLTVQARATEALAGPIDRVALEEVGDALVPDLADVAVLVCATADGPRVDLAAAAEGVDAALFDVLVRDQRFLASLVEKGRRHEAVLVRDDEAPTYDAVFEGLTALGLRSFAVAPVAGIDAGALLCATGPGRRGLRPSDLDAIGAVAERLALAFEGEAMHDAARAANARLAALANGSPVGIIELEADGTVRTVNPSAREILGMDDEPRPALHDEFRAMLDEVRYRLERNEPVLASEVSTRTNDGSPVDLWLSATLVASGSSEADHLLVVLADVTERRRLRQQVEQSQRLEALGQMAGAVAHDYNNLLTIILGYTELVQRQLGSDHPSAPDLAAVRQAGEQARTLADHLLTVSRRRVVQPEVVEAGSAVGALVPLMSRLMGRTVEVAFRASGVPAPVLIDRGQLERAILNLAINARDAMPDGGTVRISTEPAVLGADRVPAVAISVTDDGTGMDPAVQARCFEPFFTTKLRGEGTGLGLATVHAVAAQAGGDVTLRSAPGEGSTFTILLPTTDLPEEALDAPGPAVGGTERILLVEDEPGVRDFARDVLEGGGYDVTVAANGAEAAEQVTAGLTFDLLLTDVVMPGLGGVALARQVEAIHPELPVLFVSGFAEDPSLHRSGSRRPFLAKPFSPDGLLGAVRRALDTPAGAVHGSKR